jgi:hypothetical protein
MPGHEATRWVGNSDVLRQETSEDSANAGRWQI